MEFDFDINRVLKEPITLVTGNENQSRRWENGTELQEIIDLAGVKSARAQSLSAAITSWSKLRINNHRIYILSDRTSSSKATSVIGFIKVGTKQLFVLDREGNHHRTHPLCVLDFYVHESQQRKGYGLKLFKHMLQAENVHPAHLAVDRPSSKFTSFLRKHFNLWATIAQVNNFVVFDGFFRNRESPKRYHGKNNASNVSDEFRPVSRAFTEGVLNKTFRNYDTDKFNGIRPASTTHDNVAGDYFSGWNRSSSRQKPRSNMFSRFNDENSYVPSPPERRRRSLKSRQEEEIVTNPYRNVQNTMTKNLEEARIQAAKIREQEKEPKSFQQDEDSIPNLKLENNHDSSAIEDDILFDRNHDTADTPDGKPDFQVFQTNGSVEKQSDNNSTNEQDVKISGDNKSTFQSQSELFLAKAGYNSIRNYRYKNPSDMIDELKKKDAEKKRPVASNFHRYALGSSSWNIFGIPSPSRNGNC